MLQYIVEVLYSTLPSSFLLAAIIIGIGHILTRGKRPPDRSKAIRKWIIWGVSIGILNWVSRAYIEAPRFINALDKSEAGALSANLVPGNAQPPEVESGDGPYTRWIKMMLQRRVETEHTLQEDMAKLNTPALESIMTVKILNNPVAIRAAIKDINKELHLVSGVRLDVKFMMDILMSKASADADELGITENDRNIVLQKLSSKIDEITSLLLYQVDLMESLLKHSRYMLIFFLERQGRFYLQDDQYVFYSDADVQKATDIGRRFVILQQKEQELIQRFETLSRN